MISSTPVWWKVVFSSIWLILVVFAVPDQVESRLRRAAVLIRSGLRPAASSLGSVRAFGGRTTVVRKQ
jgi:hypothetical protein